MIINRKQLAKAKIEKLKRGYSAYAESKEVAQLIEKELGRLNLPVFIDRTAIGYWFIPKGQGDSHRQSPPDQMESPR
ncbi:hypothetical protein SAMN05444487_10878 [Marininema mesophilum]|uniref:Uncharacterized protein n=1 Tax=Marininema mesophilum TaxID=1048340 RepID=A0A1H2XWG9_9BACL|nr:hypothetical protein [Marininema mesophilum]SDW97243.1 hypothetical protein SAMN05444487_10878 [Marininema mesophilum]